MSLNSYPVDITLPQGNISHTSINNINVSIDYLVKTVIDEDSNTELTIIMLCYVDNIFKKTAKYRCYNISPSNNDFTPQTLLYKGGIRNIILSDTINFNIMFIDYDNTVQITIDDGEVDG